MFSECFQPVLDTHLYTKPEESEDQSTDDAEVAEPEAKGGAVENGEADMEACTCCPIQRNDDLKVCEMRKGQRRDRAYGENRVTKGDSTESLTDGESNSEHGAAQLPAWCVCSISDPVGDVVPAAPCPLAGVDWVHVLIAPPRVRPKSSPQPSDAEPG